MTGNIKIKNWKVTVIVFLSILFIILSEAAYVFTHRDVLSSYILKVSISLAKRQNMDLSLLVLTQNKFKSPDEFQDIAKNYLQNIQTSHDLPRALYDLSILAYQNNMSDLTPLLLGLATEWDPDFSFWRVELANYYLLKNAGVSAKSVLEECKKLTAPAAHCIDFENNLSSFTPQDVGFLSDSVDEFYLSKNFGTNLK